MSAMSTYRAPMHRGAHLVTLQEVLDVVDGTDLEWRLMDLHAIGRPDSGLDVLRLEQEAREPSGRAFTDSELRVLARQLHQVIDCELAAFDRRNPVEEGSPAVLALTAFDSTEWILRVGGSHRGRLDVTTELFAEL